VKDFVTDFNTAHKQNISPNTPFTKRLYNKTKLHYISATANDATTTTVNATTTTTTTTTTTLTQHRKKATGRNPRNRTRNYKQVHLADNQKRKRSSPTTENRAQQLELNCNNRYEQLSQLPDADNDDIMLTDGTDNLQLTKKKSRQRGPKPPPIFV
jgi:hypothetical protein